MKGYKAEEGIGFSSYLLELSIAMNADFFFLYKNISIFVHYVPDSEASSFAVYPLNVSVVGHPESTLSDKMT